MCNVSGVFRFSVIVFIPNVSLPSLNQSRLTAVALEFTQRRQDKQSPVEVKSVQKHNPERPT